MKTERSEWSTLRTGIAVRRVYVGERPDGLARELAEAWGLHEEGVDAMIVRFFKQKQEWHWVEVRRSEHSTGTLYRQLTPIAAEKLRNHVKGIITLKPRPGHERTSRVKSELQYFRAKKRRDALDAKAHTEFKIAYIAYNLKVLRDPHTPHTKPTYVKPRIADV